jgi:hypothetical protein
VKKRLGLFLLLCWAGSGVSACGVDEAEERLKVQRVERASTDPDVAFICAAVAPDLSSGLTLGLDATSFAKSNNLVFKGSDFRTYGTASWGVLIAKNSGDFEIVRLDRGSSAARIANPPDLYEGCWIKGKVSVSVNNSTGKPLVEFNQQWPVFD